MTTARSGRLAIHAGTVFTAGPVPVLRNTWVEVDEGRIVRVGSQEPSGANDVRRIEATNTTLLPGLIDCHVHFSLAGRPDWLQEQTEPYALACWRAQQFAAATLRAGFTTVRTLGGRPGMEVALREAQRTGLVDAPRIVSANLAICITGGHGAWMGREADGADEVRKAVREQLKAGADCVKLIATGGVMTPGAEIGAQQLNDDELAAGVEEAHRAGRKVASHAHGTAGIAAAVRAGVDSVEHGSFLTDEIIQLMRERGTFLSPTLVAPSSIVAAPPNTVPEWSRLKGRVATEANVASFRRACEAGVRIVLGTDAGTPYNLHGANARELQLMVEHGLPALAALQAATLNGAELLDIAGEVGSIAVGKQADLVLCAGDVTADVGLLTQPGNIRLVVQGGRIVSVSGRSLDP